jgi:hypothetical protein
MKSAMIKSISIVVTFFLLVSIGSPAQSRKAQSSEADIDRVVADYTKLYNAKDLEQWRRLFHPDVRISSPDANGDILVRNLKQFYAAQKKGFETDPKMREELQSIAVERGNRIAQVAADFVFVSGGKRSRGQLGLHLVEGKGSWKITSVVYAYDRGQEPR